MAHSYFENSVLMDDQTASFDKVPQDADKENVIKRIKKNWEDMKSDANGLVGLKLTTPDFDDLANHLIKSKTHAVMFELVLTKTEFRLDIDVANVTVKAGSVKLPSGLEDYRNLLASLNGWSTSTRNIVPDADFKKFNADNPKKPTVYKDYDELAKKSKTDLEAFRTWAKSKAKKALEDVDKTAKAKPTDKPRVEALKAIKAAMTTYYASFD